VYNNIFCKLPVYDYDKINDMYMNIEMWVKNNREKKFFICKHEVSSLYDASMR